VYPKNETFSPLIVGATNQATISWTPTSAAISYQLYGRGAAGWGIVYDGPLLTFVDTGAVIIPPFVPSPLLQTKQVLYNRLGTKTVSAQFSNRSTLV
jgi:hypothetical protein